jgi:hypothetical protein
MCMQRLQHSNNNIACLQTKQNARNIYNCRLADRISVYAAYSLSYYSGGIGHHPQLRFEEVSIGFLLQMPARFTCMPCIQNSVSNMKAAEKFN